MPGAFGDNKTATKPDLQTNAERKKHVKQVEAAAEEKAKEEKPKTYIGDQKELADARAIKIADENKKRIIESLKRGTMPRKEEYAIWVAELSQRDAAWLSIATYNKARGGAYCVGDKSDIFVDGKESTAEKIRNGSKPVFLHETGHGILNEIAKKDPRIYSKIRKIMDSRQSEIVSKIEKMINFTLLENRPQNLRRNYQAFGWKPTPATSNKADLRAFFDENDNHIGRADAACALMRGERSGGHPLSYWGIGGHHDSTTSHEFVANLTAARYNKDKLFFEMFNPLAQEVQDLLDSYDP